MKRNLRTQLSFGFALIILVTVALISLVSNLLITREFENYMEKQQEEFSLQLASGLSTQYDFNSGWNVDYIHGMGMYALNDGFILKVYDSDGETVWDAENHDMEMCHQIMQDIEERMDKLLNGKGEFVTHTYSLESDGSLVGTAEISYYSPYYFDENAFGFVDSLNCILLVIGILAIVAAVCIGIIFAKNITKPIVKVTEVADEIANGNYAARLKDVIKTRELDELSKSINNMAEKIEKQECMRKQLTSDVAHELRTPLANVSAQLEVILEGVFEPTDERLRGIYDEVERLSSLVSELEKLQQIENTGLELTEFNLLELSNSVISVFEAEIQLNNIHCKVYGEPVLLRADRRKIQQVITNLLSNAIKYTHSDGTVTVSVKDSGDFAELCVSDDGIGISKDEQELIFERFYRTDKSRNRKTGGVGIGLTIVNAIVKAHGGNIKVVSEEGKGSTFIVTLPKNLSED